MYNSRLYKKNSKMNLSIPKPPINKTGKELESLCRKALFDFKMLESAKSLAIALSGGKDSLTLLFILKAIIGFGTPKISLIAIHVEGDFSCGANISNNFLEKICQEIKVPLIKVKSQKPPKKESELDCYSCSRERRKLIFKTMQENHIETVAFGHHRDDLTQTLLLNLLQKGEFAAMQPKIKMIRFGTTIIRPLIYISEKKIENFASYYKFLRITCNCPKGAVSKRKETDKLIDLLEKSFPHTRKNLALSAFLYGSDKALKI